jgi:hypothetical protein
MKNKPGSIKARIPSDLKAEFVAMLRQKKISQQDALTSLVRAALRLNDADQSVLLGQIESSQDDISRAARNAAR